MSSAGEQLISNRIYDDEYYKPHYRGFFIFKYSLSKMANKTLHHFIL